MVKKLCKYEIASYTKTLLPMFAVLFGVAILNRIIQFFETDSSAYRTFFTSSLVFLIVSMVVCLVMAAVVTVIRFYRNMFTQEGYLTLTLPVTPMQHLFAKILTATLCILVSVIAVAGAGTIALSGEPLTEVFKAITFLIRELFSIFGYHLIPLAIEGILLIILGIASSVLLIYACCAVGQLAKKNRILLAVGVYFGYYFVCQTIGTVIIVIMTFIASLPPFLIAILDFLAEHQTAAAYISLSSVILFECILTVLYTLVSHSIIKNKLNLE